MMRFKLAGPLILTLLGSACAGPSQGPAHLSEQDAAAIRQIVEVEFPRLLASHDLQGIGAVLADEAIMMPFGEPAQQGRAQILDAIDRNWGALPITELTQNAVKIDGRGDLAYALGTYAITVEGEGIPRIEDRGKFVLILEKQSEGAWLISTTSYSRNIPAPEVGGA